MKLSGKRAFFSISICIFVLLSAANFLSGCMQSVSDTEICAEAIKKTIEIRCYNNDSGFGYATGCVVTDDGYILTNKHVVVSGGGFFQHIEVRFYNSDDYVAASVYKVSEDDDLAVIKIDKVTGDFFVVGNGLEGGESVFTIGNPEGFGLSFEKGTVAAPTRYVSYNGKLMKTTQVSMIINEGNSGGPLFNANGELIGLVTFRLRDSSNEVIQGIAFALHYSLINDFLSEL